MKCIDSAYNLIFHTDKYFKYRNGQKGKDEGKKQEDDVQWLANASAAKVNGYLENWRSLGGRT